jgi:hypothetical protein
MHHELESLAVAERDGAEVANVACGQPRDPELVSQRDHRCVDETKANARIATVDLHRAEKER